ncbi:MAG: alpha/beta hydrolase [Actinobacteria bacterium]|nr:alpha/beta hydrolase [Actinomycetota bacterium]
MTVYLAHATSFCAGVWRPVISQLEGIHCVAWDFPGHGSGPHLEPPFGWEVFAEHVLEITEPGGIGVGHSMGAAALAMAQLADPKRFRFLLLIEPIIFPGPHRRQEHELAVVAAKRKDAFPGREAARENFSTRAAFSRWHPEAIDGYVDCGLVGEGPVELACDPRVEAEVYRGSNDHDTWDRLGEIEVPALVLCGAESDTLSPQLARSQAERMGRAGMEVVPDSGHFLPMERPGLIANRVRRLSETFG